MVSRAISKGYMTRKLSLSYSKIQKLSLSYSFKIKKTNLFLIYISSFTWFLKNESQGHALRACVYIYIRKHNLLPFIACCIVLFEVISKLV